MDCHYINLDAATARRSGVERTFADHGPAHWTLRRFPAVGTDEAARSPGSLTPAAKACFLSHRRLIDANLTDERPLFIAEDDVVFGSATVETVDRFLRDSRPDAWDIVFTDVCIPLAQTMIELIRIRRQWSLTGQIAVLDLAGMVFGGSAAYVVNGRSKRKLATLLADASSIDVPYDLYLRRLIHDGRLAAYVFFPFVTSLSELSEDSQIELTNGASADLIWNTFRKLVWIDRDVRRHRAALQQIEAQLCDEESRLFAPLLGAMTAPGYRPK